METYAEFLNRVNSFETKSLNIDTNSFKPSDSLSDKYTPDGKCRYFFGDTVLFYLSPIDNMLIENIIDKLYLDVPECFSEKLKNDSYHMTLHDLNNSTYLNEIQYKLTQNAEIIHKFNIPSGIKIRMKGNNIINMVNTSLVLALVPADETEYSKLIGLYEQIDTIKKAEYGFTPHITLAYFNPKGFAKNKALRLKSIVENFNNVSIEIELSTDELFYCHFKNMNSFINVRKL